MILADAVARYLHGLLPQPDPVLAEMRAHGDRDGIPIVNADTGVLLELLTRAIGAQRAVEVGTAIGVSTLHIARGGAHVTTFEINAERQDAARRYLERAGLADRVDLRLQDGTAGLNELDGPFDLAFIDGPKQFYGDQLERAVELLRPGGIVLVDNALIGGAVATGEPTREWGQGHIDVIAKLNARLTSHPELLALVLPVGDGVGIGLRRL